MEDEREGKVLANSEYLDEQRATLPIEARKVSAEDWDKIMRALFVYRLGGMSFLELLAAWEDILGIARPPTTDQF